eukprot:EG_transcript_3603
MERRPALPRAEEATHPVQRCQRWLEEIEVQCTEQGVSDVPSSSNPDSQREPLAVEPPRPESPMTALEVASNYSHRRPLEVSPRTLEVSVARWSYIKEGWCTRYVVYHVCCRQGLVAWEVTKRFSTFVLLDQLLAHQEQFALFVHLRQRSHHGPPLCTGEEMPLDPLPALPPRKLWPRTNGDVGAINERCIALHRYLQALLQHPRAPQMSALLMRFLAPESRRAPPPNVRLTTVVALPAEDPAEAEDDRMSGGEGANPLEARSAARVSARAASPSLDPRRVQVQVQYPEWVPEEEFWHQEYTNDSDKMLLAIDISTKNVANGTGGPFGAAIFDRSTGRVISVGMSLVDLQKNCCLHAETVAIQMATSALFSCSLDRDGMSPYELFASSEPCAMCIGAILWSGVQRLVCAATDVDVRMLMHDTGPVFEDSFKYLRSKGLQIDRKFMRAEAKQVISAYASAHTDAAGRQV